MNNYSAAEFAKRCKAANFEHFCYPITIVQARYQGVYEGGIWLAFPVHYYQMANNIHGDDTSCCFFFDELRDLDCPYGIGNAPDEAKDDLIKKVKESQ